MLFKGHFHVIWKVILGSRRKRILGRVSEVNFDNKRNSNHKRQKKKQKKKKKKKIQKNVKGISMLY